MHRKLFNTTNWNRLLQISDALQIEMSEFETNKSAWKGCMVT